MKTNKILSILAVLVALSLSGCAINSGNVGKNIKPLPYGTDEVARVTKKTMTSTNPDGGVITFEQTTKTGLEVNSEIQHHRLDMATQVGVAQAKKSSSGGGFWGWLTTPTPYYGGGGYYTSGGYYGGSYPNCGSDNMSPHLGGGGVALGGYVVSSPGGNNNNFYPNIGGGGNAVGGAIISGGGHH